jgi:hypothetical protein
VLVKSPEDRKKLERSAPLLVATRDQAVVELKREKLAAELNQRNLQNHTCSAMSLRTPGEVQNRAIGGISRLLDNRN